MSPASGSVNAAENAEPAETKPVAYDLEVSNGALVQGGKQVEATLANVVDALRARYQHANIVIAPGLSRVRIADLKLRAGDLLDELEAVRVASGEKFDIQGPRNSSPPGLVDPKTGLPVQEPTNSGLFALQEATAPPQRERVVEAFNLEPYLASLRKGPPNENAHDREVREQQSLDELTQIVTETIGMMKNDSQTPDQPEFRFHRGASILVVIGSRDSVEVARKIVNALPGMGTPPRADPASNAAAMDAFRRRYGLAPVPADGSGTAAPAPAKK